jgi:hypothetical protein
MNAEWHKHNEMPKNAKVDQKIAWHIQHARHCGCRPIPKALMPEIEQRFTPKQFQRLRELLHESGTAGEKES